MDIDSLALLRSIAQLGSLSAAARVAGLPVMTVSRRLAKLEQQLGVRLFHRTTRFVAPTPEGEAMLPHIVALLAAHEAALAAISIPKDEVSGILKVTAPNVIGREVLLPAIMRLMEAHPSLRVDLTLSDTIVDIVREGMDLAIRVAPLESSELVASLLAPNPRILCAAPLYLARHGRPALLQDLQHHSCLTLHGMPHWPLQSDKGAKLIAVTGNLIANSIEAVRAACIAGAGLALLSYWDMRDCLAQGLVEEIALADAQPAELGIWAVYPTRQQMPRRVRVMIEALRADLKA